MLTTKGKRLVWLGIVILIIATMIIWLLGNKNNISKKTKRVDGSLDGSGTIIYHNDPKHPCSTQYKQAEWEPQRWLCYNTTNILKTVVMPGTAFETKYRQQNPTQWIGYDFYLDAHSRNTRDSWWGDTFITTSQTWKPSSYGWTQLAKQWKKIITGVAVDNTKVQFTINSTAMPLNKKKCAHIRICAWATGTDPCWELGLCPNITANNGTELSNKTGGTIKPVERPGKNSKIQIIDPDSPVDDWFKITTGVSRIDNNWLLMVEQAAKASGADCVVCMGARPLLQVVPSALGLDCLVDVMNKTIPSENCSSWDKIYPLTTAEKQKPLFSKKVAVGNFTCINRTGAGVRLGKLNDTQCYSVETVNMAFKPKARSDIWWWCGDDRLFDRLPYNTTGFCASVSLILPVSITPLTVTDLLTTVNVVYPHTWKSRPKRSVMTGDPTYIDSIGIPRGVPDEYKLINQVAAGFESSLCWWCTINKNVDRINYIHYNVQRLGNKTEEGFSAIHEQLSATSPYGFPKPYCCRYASSRKRRSLLYFW
ncbi:uncharacterized protein LOC123492877 [Coregonus clupeaformis]|uniref:uncharacterized protein LOC123492877 n=1 Tax=Coregonus clupeaformis TaxID=59861 RepID=UPI001E1C25A1|nr:uncharacterized protein LOC123492877 [Coregonus clupeaformis]